MTSLIDVIFLLLLFFMLSSTFSRFAEVEIVVGSATGSQSTSPDQTLLFLRLTRDGMTLNGQPVVSEALGSALSSDPQARLLISVTRGATAQALADALVAARSVPGLSVTVLEAL